MNQTPLKKTYEKALETVAKYEKRQRQLAAIEEELSSKLQEFKYIKFKVDKKGKRVLFTGLHSVKEELLIGESDCRSNDKFEDVIGKLISVKKALNEDVEAVVNLVEESGAAHLYIDGKLITANGFNGQIRI
ncbi:hypothetical protein [Lederbergia lenta]|uniref:hypothetical protein n=1 Tax=Lederbergia lenta TaxID=1467 RepID=UPI002041F6E7|nr:hypothetical protein [Lederbergia lenta]MCM3109863.1 hypothetical protein [Lederbergia lenta]